MASSGTTAYSPSLADLSLEVFERNQYRSASLTAEMLASCRRSFNLVFSRWSNLGVNLWRVSDPIRVPLRQGVGSYAIDASVISILPEAYIRQYTMQDAFNVDPDDFATVINTPTVTINQTAHGILAGTFIQVGVPVSVGGLIVYGYYIVDTVPSANAFTIDTGEDAAATDSAGAVPRFETFTGSATVQVRLQDHGYMIGDLFTVDVDTDVGGITFTGSYTIVTILDVDTFTITSSEDASSDATGFENSGLTQLAAQNPQIDPIDRVIYPLSRADYSATANKTTWGVPTSYWFNRQVNPTINFWPLADNGGPYEFQYYALKQIEDANNQGNETPNVPYRGLEALASAVAAHFSMKWKPELFQQLSSYAQQMFVEFSSEDREKVTLSFVPDFSAYG